MDWARDVGGRGRADGAVAVGGTSLFFVLRAWARKGKRGAEETVTLLQPVSAQETEEYRGRLQEELKMYKEEGPV